MDTTCGIGRGRRRGRGCGRRRGSKRLHGKARGRGLGGGQARGRACRLPVLQVALAQGRAREAAAACRCVHTRLDPLKGSMSPAIPENEILELFGDFDAADESEMFNGGLRHWLGLQPLAALFNTAEMQACEGRKISGSNPDSVHLFMPILNTEAPGPQ